MLRLSNAFGMPIHRSVNCWMLLVNDLCKQAVQSQKLILKSDGLQLRDFISLKEVCRIVGEITVANEKFRAIRVFNLGSGTSRSVREMSMLVQRRSKKVLGFEPELYFSREENKKAQAPLIYGVQNLAALNIAVRDSSSESEVDSMLRFCSVNFT